MKTHIHRRALLALGFVLLLFSLPQQACCQGRKLTSAAEVQPVENSPMSCRMEGRIVRYIKEAGVKKGELCARHPCHALVQVLDVGGCGSAVTVPLNTGDTVAIRFAYSLHPSAKIFPRMKAKLPGLKPGNVFSANVQARMAMGKDGVFVVYSYLRK